MIVKEILELATKIEGHPDNVAPAIFGGLTVSVMEEEQVLTLNIPVKHEYRFVALIPPLLYLLKNHVKCYHKH